MSDDSDKMKDRAREASRRTNIDTMVWLNGLLRKTYVDPRAIDHASDAPDKDKILLHVYDLLHMATYAYYNLQEEAYRAIQNAEDTQRGRE